MPPAWIFHSCIGGRGQILRTAGFQTCCIADFLIVRAAEWRGVRRFGNPRYSRLGSLRHTFNYEISRLDFELRVSISSVFKSPFDSFA